MEDTTNTTVIGLHLTTEDNYTNPAKPQNRSLTVSPGGVTSQEKDLQIARYKNIGNAWDTLAAEQETLKKKHIAHQKLFEAGQAQVAAGTALTKASTSWNKFQSAVAENRISRNEARNAIAAIPIEIERQNVELEKKVFSCLIHGGMGAGKSVLVNNLICCAQQELEAVYGLPPELVLIDPKFPDSEWIIGGKRIKPNYRGCESAIAGVTDMGAEVDSRFTEAQKIAEEIDEELFSDPSYELPLPERTPTIWVIDEAASLHERYKNEFSDPLKNAFWVGRSTRNVAIAIGQNPNCSNYGLQRPDAENASRFFLGAAMALKGLDELKTNRELKTKIRQQIYARLALVRQRKLQGYDLPEEQYFGLV